MNTTQTTDNLVELCTDAEHILHRIGSEDYPTIRRIMVKATDAANYEEVSVADIPVYTKAEYDAEVERLIAEKYSAGEESALKRKMINVLMSPDTISEEGEPSKIIAEYQAYNVYVQGCKLKAKDPELYNKDKSQL